MKGGNIQHRTANAQYPLPIAMGDMEAIGLAGRGRGEDGELRMAKSGAERFFHERFDKTGKQCEGAFRFGRGRITGRAGLIWTSSGGTAG